MSYDQTVAICFCVGVVSFLTFVAVLHSRNTELEFRKWQATNAPVRLEAK